jgi:hypothetical protein
MNQPPSQSIEFAGFVLSHCAVIADGHRSGQLICPFAALCDSKGQLRVVAFESETQEEAVGKGWSSLDTAREEGEWWGFGREGLVRTADGPLDVLIVTVWTPEQEDTFSITQTFGRAEDGSLYLIGEPELLLGGREESLVQAQWDSEALLRGIAQHPHGGKWSEWRKQ